MLAWELDNTLEAAFRVDALTGALERYGAPLVSNTDQGSQFTGGDWLGVLEDAGVRISMDGRGRWIDNRFIERLWRSLKYEPVYLDELVGGHHARRVIASWLDHYNHATTTRQPRASTFGAGRTDARGGPLRGAAGTMAGGRVRCRRRSRSGRYAPCARTAAASLDRTNRTGGR